MSDDKSPEKIVITNRKTVWVAYTNTDYTDGRGHDLPIAICLSEVTARRFARGRYTQGSDGPVRAVELLEINGEWHAPSAAFSVIAPTRDDDKEQAKLDAKREALEKALAAGLTEDDLSALGISSGGR